MALIDLANPTRFLALTARVLPWLVGRDRARVRARALSRLAVAPDDYQQGATVKIMFIHVPTAWLAMGVWTVMSIAALGTLVWRHPLADVAAKAAAPLGAAFTFLAWSPARSGAGRCGAPIGCGTRGSPRCWCCS